MPVFDTKAYRESLKTKYNIPDEDLAPLADKGEITQGFMRQDDYSRQSQAVQTERAALQAKHQSLMEYETWVQSYEAKYGPREQWDAAFQRAIGQYNPDGSGSPVSQGLNEAEVQRRIDAAVSGAVSRVSEQFAQQLEQVGQGSARFAEFYYDANKRWETEYGKSFPKDDFKKFYQENGHTNPQIALQLFESPYRADKEKAAWESKLAEAEARGETRGRSQSGVPGSGSGSWAADGGGISIGAAAGRTLGGDPNAAPSTEQREQEAAFAIRSRLEGMDKVTPLGGGQSQAAAGK